MKRLIVLVTATFLTSCGGQGSPRKQTASPEVNRHPSATEVFHLRSECAALGQRILDGNVIGSALTQSQVSHYDPQTNRCYVELTVRTADLTKPMNYFGDYLFDGQTGEMLATARIENGKKSGVVFVFGVGPPDGVFKRDPDIFFNQASDFINAKMADDRRQ